MKKQLVFDDLWMLFKIITYQWFNWVVTEKSQWLIKKISGFLYGLDNNRYLQIIINLSADILCLVNKSRDYVEVNCHGGANRAHLCLILAL